MELLVLLCAFSLIGIIVAVFLTKKLEKDSVQQTSPVSGPVIEDFDKTQINLNVGTGIKFGFGLGIGLWLATIFIGAILFFLFGTIISGLMGSIVKNTESHNFEQVRTR